MSEPAFRDPTMPLEMQERIGDGYAMLPGMDGIPFRTREPGVQSYKEDDPAHLRPQVVHDVDVRIFHLDKEDDLKEYKKILNACAQGLGRLIGTPDTQYNEETGTWKVLLTWAMYFYEDPRETKSNQIKYYT